MKYPQTHTVAGQGAVKLPQLGDIYFLEHGGHVTGWAVSKRGTSVAPAPSDTQIEVSRLELVAARESVDSYQLFQEMTKDFQGGHMRTPRPD